jgi:hypothetical protein
VRWCSSISFTFQFATTVTKPPNKTTAPSRTAMFSNSKLTVIAVCVIALFSSGHADTTPELPQRRLRGDSYGGGVTQSFNFNAAGGGGGGYGGNSAQNNNPVPLPAVPAFVPAPAMPSGGTAVYVPAPAAAPSGCEGGVGNGDMNSNCQSAPAFAPAPAPLPQVPTGATNLWCKDAAGNDIDPSNCFSGPIPAPQPALASVPTQVSASAPAPAPLPQVPTGATNLWCKDAAGNDIDPSNCFSGPIPAPQPALASVPIQVSAPASGTSGMNTPIQQ